MVKAMIEKKTWREFKDAKMLWWINRLLHTFGWAIVLDMENGEITAAYPARVKFRGFDEKSESEGFIGLTDHLKTTVNQLADECRE